METPVALYTTNDLMMGLATAGGRLYFTDDVGVMELLVLDPDGGGAPTVLGSIPLYNGVSYYGNNVAADATHVYWVSDETASDGEAAGVELDGGNGRVLATGQVWGPSCLTLDATNLYFADIGASEDGGSVWKVPLGGGPPVQLASAAFPYFLAVDSTSLYWSSLGGGVQWVPIDGGAVSTLAGVDYAGAGIAVGGGYVYFGFDESLEALSLDAGTVTVLANNQVYAQGLVLDGTTLYWTNSGEGLDAGSVMKLPLGCLEPIELATTQLTPSPPYVDGAGVYWIDYSSPFFEIMRIPK